MASPRSPEGVAARKVKAAIDSLDLDPSVFAYIFVDDNPVIQAQMFRMVIALIDQWAKEFEKGNQEFYTLDAMRLRDTIDAFQMEVR